MRSRYWLRFESGERSGEVVPIPPSGFNVGRKPPEGGLTISDASVSGRHARLLVEERGVRVLDLGSTNGTRVDGDVIDEALVTPGSIVAFGKIRFHLGEGQASAPADLQAGQGEPGPAEGRGANRPTPDHGITQVALEGPGDELVIEGLDEVSPVPVPAQALPAAPVRSPGRREPEPRGATSAGSDLGSGQDGGLSAVSQERVQRSARSSKLVGLAVISLLGAGGLLLWQAFAGGSQGASEALDPVVAVPGDLLEDGSFEVDAGGWENDPSAPVAFYRDGLWRASGAVGFGVDLLEGEWALARSSELRVAPRQPIQLRGQVAGSGVAAGRLGLELFRAGSAGPASTAWSELLSARGDELDATLSFDLDVPPAFDSARIVVAAFAAPGTIGAESSAFSIDDVQLVPGGPGGDGVDFGDHRFDDYGDGGLLSRVDRVLLDGVRFVRRGAALPSGYGGSAALVAPDATSDLTVVATERGFRIASALRDPTTLELRVGAELVEAGLATTGAGGYRSQSYEFDLDAASSLVLGSGLGLLRLVLPAGVPLRGRPHPNGGLAVRAELPAQAEVELQLSFVEDRGEATRLAELARKAERGGRAGVCFERWGELLERYPFESKLVHEAEEARGRLLAAGADEVAGIRRELERARFFELGDLYRECMDDANAVAQRYGEGDVGRAAGELALLAEAEWNELGGRVDRRAAALEMILGVLQAEQAPELAKYVSEQADASSGVVPGSSGSASADAANEGGR